MGTTPDFAAQLGELSARFSELDEDIENLSGLERGQHLEIIALRAALLSIVSALADIAPAIRTVIAEDLEVRLQRAFENHPAITDGDFEAPYEILDDIRQRT